MALAVRQILASSRNSATSITRTYASAVLSGSLLVASGSIFNANGTTDPALSDSVNGAWAAATTSGFFFADPSHAETQIGMWSFPNSAAGTPQVTMDPPGGGSDNDLTLFEITGAATTTPRDVSVTASGVSNSAAVTTGTLAQADEIVIAVTSQVNPTTTLTNDTADSFTQADENENNSTGQCFHTQYRIVTATTSLTVNTAIGASVGWFTAVASFKQAAAGGGVVGPLLDGHLIHHSILQGRLAR